MGFTAYEMLRVLLASTNLSREDIFDNGGPHPRVQQRILNENPGYRIRNEAALIRLLMEQGVLPYDKAWQYPITKLYPLIQDDNPAAVETQFAAVYALAEVVINEKPDALSPGVRCGAIFFAALYQLAFTSSKNGAYVKFRQAAANASCQYFQALINELQDDHTPGGTLIKAKAAANIVVARWNATPKSERDSSEMREMIANTGYLHWTGEQTKLFPKLDTPAFNALGIASRFRRRDLYPSLLEALSASSSPFKDYPQYNDGDDGDYADFRSWLAEQSAPNPANENNPKERPMKKSKLGKTVKVVVLGLGILASGLIAHWGPSETTAEVATLDLRPHVGQAASFAVASGVPALFLAIDIRPHEQMSDQNLA